jgi:hypothetical protein
MKYISLSDVFCGEALYVRVTRLDGGPHFLCKSLNDAYQKTIATHELEVRFSCYFLFLPMAARK